MILDNGVVRTMEPSLPTAAALAIAGDRIAGGVSTHETALPTLERVDLRGRCVLPGFTDSHVHFPTWALAQRQPRLEGCTSLAEAVDRVRGAVASASSGRWLVGYGWRSADWTPEVEPTRHDLDPVTGAVPVALWAKDDHSLWLNSAGLAHANGDLAVPGGVVELDDRGDPTGLLREESAWRFRERHIRVSEDDLVDATRAAISLAHARGVTAVHDKDGWLGALRIWQRLQVEGRLSVRVWQSLPHERLDELTALGLRSGFGDDFLRIGYLKVFMDGTLSSGTGWMLDGSGVVITSGAELAEIVRRSAEAGWPIAVHAIGDRANREALDAFEATREVWQTRRLRPRVEHAQLVDPADLPRFAALGVACSVQFSHAPSDRDLADRRWSGKAGAYAFRSLWESGALVANGSDAPIEELDPLLGIRAGVLRTLDQREGWRSDEAVTAEQALRATTVNPAWLAGDEHQRGRLIPGYLADLVVLDRDPVACPPEELADVRVVATMVGGRWVHSPPPWE